MAKSGFNSIVFLPSSIACSVLAEHRVDHTGQKAMRLPVTRITLNPELTRLLCFLEVSGMLRSDERSMNDLSKSLA